MTKRFLVLLPALLMAGFVAACSEIAIRSAPPKEPRASTSALAAQATKTFWDSFFEARYDQIPRIQMLLTAAYLENPNDPKLTLLLAHTHLWKASERSRLERVPPEITDHLILADRYFEEAGRLAPDDARIPGWLGGVKMALATIHRDERLKRQGYFMAKDAAAVYPEFNLFSLAYPLMAQPHDSPRFAESVEAMWKNTEVCLGRTFDRARPRFGWADSAGLVTDRGPKRVCWNTSVVPHNAEGFLLHLGDTLLKNGQKEAAQAAYRVIKEVPEYPRWRFQAALEERLANLDDWRRRMRDGVPGNDPPYMLNSPMACTGCHAR